MSVIGIILCYIVVHVCIYFIILLTNKKSNDEGRFYGMRDAYRGEAYKEVLQRCKEELNRGEVSYLSIEDIINIVNELKEGK